MITLEQMCEAIKDDKINKVISGLLEHQTKLN